MNKTHVNKYLKDVFYYYDFYLNKVEKTVYLNAKSKDYINILTLEIKYTDNNEKIIIYNEIMKLIKYFDFSFNLEFFCIWDLRIFVKTIEL